MFKLTTTQLFVSVDESSQRRDLEADLERIPDFRPGRAGAGSDFIFGPG